ncbi:M phase phosphoprotein 10 [Elaeis guineensis]|uniref:U3 small nucleolar ribonucleoprotein protein MPP10 n=1 Tax=Elaeis guineensis var. tenera TaxID=51953 RepID=A0A6I9RP49_ELAGV|nr:U3 small nucleolar ribonucleoprotein protein MPP10 [Elaeis guineensis]
MAAVEDEKRGEEALERLKAADPPLYLSPSTELSQVARAAARHLYSALLPFCPKAPVDRLIADDGFDAEQIWYQIDLLSRPLVSTLRREVRRLEREPPEVLLLAGGKAAAEAVKGGHGEEGEEEEEDDDGEEDEEEEDAVAAEEEEEDGREEEEDEEEEGEGKGQGVEDRFLKIKELEEYLEKNEEEEYWQPERRKRKQKRDEEEEEGDEEEEEEENEEDADEADLELGDFDEDGDEETDLYENARYEDFFGGKKKRGLNKKDGGRKREDSDEDDLSGGSEDQKMDDENIDTLNKNNLSTHEKELQQIRSKIEQMEKANLEPKSWTMQGEVTAAKRPMNSALEVDLDFEHNVRPAPVITEEVTATLEDLIRKRIMEGHFDDVQRAPVLPSKAPKEYKELDENKSKKGLAEIYEEEYAQKTGLAPQPLSVSDEQKKEASILFKKLCLKLDALSHFNFAPKPVIEDMSVQANVPALAMEEIAPLAVSDAAMLAPEEIFEGKGDIKEEVELTQADRKRRRANKKRKFKAEMTKRARQSVDPSHPSGKQDS